MEQGVSMTATFEDGLQAIIQAGELAAEVRVQGTIARDDPRFELLRQQEILGKQAASLRVPEPELETQTAAVNEEPTDS